MELPEGFAVPDDIDYSRYAADAVGMIRDLGVIV
jgi:hypothetical protein